jgi:hypothetical protein
MQLIDYIAFNATVAQSTTNDRLSLYGVRPTMFLASICLSSGRFPTKEYNSDCAAVASFCRNLQAESSDETSGIYPTNVTASYTRMS